MTDREIQQSELWSTVFATGYVESDNAPNDTKVSTSCSCTETFLYSDCRWSSELVENVDIVKLMRGRPRYGS